jgi:uncharacterized Fe-S cluster-containing radical SAM superfamily protein
MGLSKTDGTQLRKAKGAIQDANELLVDALANAKSVLARVHQRGVDKDEKSKAGEIAVRVATFERNLNNAIEALLKVEEQAGNLLKG